jgi:cytochrome c biogenesis protein CcdA
MADLWTVLVPIIIADVINPVLFAFMVYAAGTDRPIGNALVVLLGHTTAYLSAGILLAFGMERITDYLSKPHTIDYLIGLVIGLLLLWVAFLSSRKKPDTEKEQSEQLTPLKAFGFGAIINFIGIPFALPYFAAIDQVLKENLSVVDSLLVLLGYNLLYAAPFLIVPILSILFGLKSRALLERINNWIDRVSSVLMPIILGLVGLALMADSVAYLAKGKGLW